MTDEVFSKTRVVWWRFGREHGGEQLQVNPAEVLDAHFEEKIERVNRRTTEAWRWWQVDENLIVEKPPPDGPLFDEDSRIYYLRNRGISVIDNVDMPPPDDCWAWFIHIADFSFEERLDSWLMKDLFLHIVVEDDNRTYHLYDLPDMALALDAGLITSAQSADILRRVDWVVNKITNGEFPFDEILRGREAAERLGW